MPISCQCAACKSKLEVHEKFAGAWVTCPKCNKRVDVPTVVAAAVDSTARTNLNPPEGNPFQTLVDVLDYTQIFVVIVILFAIVGSVMAMGVSPETGIVALLATASSALASYFSFSTLRLLLAIERHLRQIASSQPNGG